MSVVTFIAIIALIWTGRELIVGIFIWRSRHIFRNELRKERAEGQFAIARNKLMNLALASEIDVNTISFKSFYSINTAFMRRPDQYSEMTAALVHLFLNVHDSSQGEELQAESKRWSPAFREVVKDTADAMDYLVLDYSWIIRWMFRLEKRHNPDSTPLRMLKRLAYSVEKEQPIADIRQTQNAMYRMAQGAA